MTVPYNVCRGKIQVGTLAALRYESSWHTEKTDIYYVEEYMPDTKQYMMYNLITNVRTFLPESTEVYTITKS